MTEKVAIITGVTGQDGAYLAKLLLGKGYRVVGTHRPTSSVNLWRLHELKIAADPNLELVEHDVADLGGSIRLIGTAAPDEIYNLAAQSFVGLSFKQPVTTAQITALGALNLLEAIRIVNPKIRFYQASSSEMFGDSGGAPHDESSPLRPRSPYAVSKLFAHWSTVNYREAFGLYAVSGILFNHESPLRGLEFVTRKITDAVARISLGKLEHLALGNLDAKRDWGHAEEYVDGIWRMLQADAPDTYVLATGEANSIRDFVTQAFLLADVPIEWRGVGCDEVAVDSRNGTVRVRVDQAFYRPTDTALVLGDARRAAEKLGWRAKSGLREICQSMLQSDLRRQSSALSGVN